jgi:hypothetical protein
MLGMPRQSRGTLVPGNRSGSSTIQGLDRSLVERRIGHPLPHVFRLMSPSGEKRQVPDVVVRPITIDVMDFAASRNRPVVVNPDPPM